MRAQKCIRCIAMLLSGPVSSAGLAGRSTGLVRTTQLGMNLQESSCPFSNLAQSRTSTQMQRYPSLAAVTQYCNAGDQANLEQFGR